LTHVPPTVRRLECQEYDLAPLYGSSV